jgi:uncharacterized repeat protein (TIGR01451 family)
MFKKSFAGVLILLFSACAFSATNTSGKEITTGNILLSSGGRQTTRNAFSNQCTIGGLFSNETRGVSSNREGWAVMGDDIATAAVRISKSAVNKGPNGTDNRPGDRGARVGDILQYTLSWTNNGSAAAASTNIYDMIPANTVYVTGSATGVAGYITSRNTLAEQGTEPNPAAGVLGLRWNLTNVAIGNAGTITYRVKLNTP